MTYLSELLRRPIVDADGERLGQVEDLIASADDTSPRPSLVAFKAQGSLFPLAAIVSLEANPLCLRMPREQLTPYAPAPSDLPLAQAVLDKHIIDTDCARTVRVNDVELLADAAGMWVAAVDVGGAGLLRRLGLGRIAQLLLAQQNTSRLDWSHVRLLADDQAQPGPADELADLHPADRAEIISDMALPESSAIIKNLDAETAADTLEAVEPDFQARLVETLPDEQLLKIMEEMSRNEAADLLGELPADRRDSLLAQMTAADAAEFRRLLAYPPGTAGSLMSTGYAALPVGLTAGETIARLHALADAADTLYYIYVTDAENRLVGVLALSDLVLAAPDAPMQNFMRRRVIAVNVQAHQTEVAQVVSKYHLLAVPVVDDDQHLLGMITSAAALSPLIPAEWKKHWRQRYA